MVYNPSKFHNIFEAHRIAKKALILYGVPGIGKSSIIRDYALNSGNFKHFIDMRVCDTDVLDLAMISIDPTGTKVNTILNENLTFLTQTEDPVLVVLEEFNQPNKPSVFAAFKQILNERAFKGKKISDTVTFFATANYEDEESYTYELPEALKKRLTHLHYTPQLEDFLTVASEDLKKILIKAGDKILSTRTSPIIEDLSCMRQLTDLMEMSRISSSKNDKIEYLLSGNELLEVAQGRLGTEKGMIFATIVEEERKQLENAFPEKMLSKKDQLKLKRLEKNGQTNEVYHYILSRLEHHQPSIREFFSRTDGSGDFSIFEENFNIAQFLIEHATNELCQLIFTTLNEDEGIKKYGTLLVPSEHNIKKSLQTETIIKKHKGVEYKLLPRPSMMPPNVLGILIFSGKLDFETYYIKLIDNTDHTTCDFNQLKIKSTTF